MKVVAAPEIFNSVKIGDSTVLKLAEEYQRMRKNVFNLTCYQRSFCHHEINTNRTRQWYGPEVPHSTGSPSGWVKTARQLLRYLRIHQMTPCLKLNDP